MGKQIEDDSCQVKFNENGIDVEGPCAEQFVDMFTELSTLSRALGSEITGYACIDAETGRIKKAGIYEIGSPRESSLAPGRSCACEQPQVTFHSHPLSGLAQFSDQDARTVVARLNKVVDQGHCVVGEHEVMCIFASRMDLAQRTQDKS